MIKAAVLLVKKPVGWSSARCVQRVKTQLGLTTVRVGHAGTLDPFASGLLIVLIGGATKLFPYLLTGAKTYVVTAQLHVATNSGDHTGQVTHIAPAQHPTAAAVHALFAQYQRGWYYQQQVPAFSAARCRGRRFYDYVRRGQNPPFRSKPVVIYQLQLIKYVPHHDRITFQVRCSSGCYVRAVVGDLGTRLRVIATTTGLIRTGIGPWTIQQAVPCEQVTVSNLMTMSTVLADLHIPLLPLSLPQQQAATNGMVLQLRHRAALVAVTNAEHTLLAIYEHARAGVYRVATRIY